MLFGFYIPPVHFKGVTHGLESVERQPDGQYNIEYGKVKVAGIIDVCDEKVIVFKKYQQANIGHKAAHKPFLFLIRSLNKQRSKIIDKYKGN